MVAVVQTAQNVANATSVTVTLGGATTAGNCLVAAAQTSATTTNGTVSGITLGGAAGNWGSLYSVGTGASNSILMFWADPNCASGQTSVVVTTTGSSGTQSITATVWEVSGLPSVLGSLLDQSAGTAAGASSSSFTSGTTGMISQASEIAFGMVNANPSVAITGPSSPWVNSAEQNGTVFYGTAGYALLSSACAVSYAGAFSPATAYGAAVITLFTSPGVSGIGGSYQTFIG